MDWRSGILAIVFIVTVGLSGIYAKQSDFTSIITLLSASYLSFLALYFWSDISTKSLLGIGILARLVLLFLMPQLSDDIYRFYWDGLLSLSNVNPYGILPGEALGKHLLLDKTLFDHLNSPNYYTVYPPLAQLTFWVAALGGSLMKFNIILKLIFIGIEYIGVKYAIRLLEYFNKPDKYSLVYYLCPLVIIEGIGNLHFEIVMMSFLVIALYYFLIEKHIRSALFLALSIAAKLLPLMLLPYIFFKLKSNQKWIFLGLVFILCILFFSPIIISGALQSILSSIDLYFRKFEFNASIYFVLRWIGKELIGYNLIHILGPLLGLITVSSNAYIAYRYAEQKSKSSFLKYAIIVWLIYLLLATTVHPWYIIPLVYLSIFTSQKRNIVLWSSLVFLSYAHYDNFYSPYYYILISIEYLIVFWMFKDIFLAKFKKTTSTLNN